MDDMAHRRTDAETGTEVVGVAKRRVFTATYKRRILDEADCARPGQIGWTSQGLLDTSWVIIEPEGGVHG